jgi:hypothetical protein
MGLLDEAIREHLELKRRAGIDPGEVARMEQDALGPVVRGEPPAEPIDELEVPAPGPIDQHPEGADEDPAPEQAAEVFEPEVAASEPSGHEPSHGVGQPTEEYDVESAELEHPPAEPHQPEPAPPAEGEPGPGEKSQADEILEKTPEFLQETPEHDRLWFEQGPPQEFDFDK